MMRRLLCPQFTQYNERIPKDKIWEVVQEARKGDERAIAKIFKSYSRWIAMTLSSRKHLGMIREDLYDCAVDAIYRAIKNFDPTLSANFLRRVIEEFYSLLYGKGYKTTRYAARHKEYDPETDNRGKEQKHNDLPVIITNMLDSIKPKQSEIIREVYGIGREMPKAKTEVALEMGVSSQAVDERVNTALANLRKNKMSKELRCYL